MDGRMEDESLHGWWLDRWGGGEVNNCPRESHIQPGYRPSLPRPCWLAGAAPPRLDAAAAALWVAGLLTGSPRGGNTGPRRWLHDPLPHHPAFLPPKKGRSGSNKRGEDAER